MKFSKHTSKKLVALFNKKPFQGQFTRRVSRRFFWRKLAGKSVLILALCFLLLPDDNSLQKNQVLHNGRVSIAGEVNKIPELYAKPSGKVVFQRSDGIYIIIIGTKKPQRLVEYGTFPRWSPDGKFVAFIDGNRIMLVSSRGGKPQLIATATKAKAVCFNPDGHSLLFTDAKRLRRVDIKRKKITTVLKGYEFLEIDVAGNGSRLAATVRTSTGFSVRAFDLDTGENRSVARGCSASLSPDGSIITVNGRKHRALKMYHWDSLERVAQITAPSGKKFDNHFWSNSQRWVVSTSEGEKHDIYIHHVPSDTSYRITSSGDCDRGDLFVSG